MVKSSVIAKKQSKKQRSGKSGGPGTAGATQETAEQAMERAHGLIARQDFDAAVTVLEGLLTRGEDATARELIGVVECERGEVEKGREHLLKLLKINPEHSSATPHLYLAQTALTPRDALASYESALKILQKRLEALSDGKSTEEDTEDEIKKECVMVFVAMVEIWMSDLCFEADAPTHCNALISRALEISPQDPDALLTLASIRMSESRPEEAREIVVAVADRVARIAEHLEAKEDTEVTVAAMDEDRDLELPPIQTRGLLARLLLEHEDYPLALRMVETIRSEDDEDVEGCYLEGWGWYCRGKALEEASKEKDDAGVTVEECYMEALSALLECQSLHIQQDHPDEGILTHTNELVAELEGKGIKVEVEDEEGDVEMQ
ncbi:hypothetical protein NliqN6_4227 [Naganishia liquefaciens]|uniref:Tetratricopeptide repeat protein n=1 Tax=Naganishia liquefaciens TaxID=104408 RepID=A0A8H3TW31_9TREE|nr:hypothetical protein NliqN6_4227 [Naganishia liquefaciens]